MGTDADPAGGPGGEVRLPRLLADTMLGRLARALRLIGLDTAYADEQGRGRALEQAILTGRVIVTRDRRLNAYGCRRVLAVSDHWEEQLAQVLSELGLDREALPAFSRCSRCNREIIAVSRNQVRDTVPPFVFATQREFHRCPGCGRVYWAGTHVTRMQRRLGVAPR